MAAPVLQLDDLDLQAMLARLQQYPPAHCGFVVTPNVDHVIRYVDEPDFRVSYSAADFVVLDSRFLRMLLGWFGSPQPAVCTGSDLTAAVFEQLVQADDPLVVIGGSDAQIAALRQRYGLAQLRHHNPPMGFIDDPAAVQQCLEFIEAVPFRYCFLAVGSPRQEQLALQIKQRGKATGAMLCIGASINFLTGGEQRAPQWMQRLNLEWLYRLLQDPARMWRRYLVRGPRIFWMLLRRACRFEIRTARSAAAHPASPEG